LFLSNDLFIFNVIMFNTYSFLTEHSYSLRPEGDNDNQRLLSNKKKKTSRRSTLNRTSKAKKTSNRTISIDRSSSDKENTSTPVRSSARQVTSKNSGKKQDKKIPVKKTTSGGAIQKKKISTKSIETFDAPPSLSIEERVKLRRTKTIQPSMNLLPKQTSKVRQSQTFSKKNISKKSPIKQPISKKSTKFFLGSGLDLDNIVLGNRQRRSVQT